MRIEKAISEILTLREDWIKVFEATDENMPYDLGLANGIVEGLDMALDCIRELYTAKQEEDPFKDKLAQELRARIDKYDDEVEHPGALAGDDDVEISRQIRIELKNLLEWMTTE